MRKFTKYPSADVESDSSIFCSGLTRKVSQELQSIISSLAKAWRGWAGINIEMSDDCKGITFPDKSGSPVSLRIEVKSVPEYHVYDEFQEEIIVTMNKAELQRKLSDVIRERRL